MADAVASPPPPNRRPGAVRRAASIVLLVAAVPTLHDLDSFGPVVAVGPYLQSVTSASATVLWETHRPATTALRWGTRLPLEHVEEVPGLSTHHEVVLRGLAPAQRILYQVCSTSESGRTIASSVASFSTAPPEGAPFVLAVVGDTQDQPDVWSEVAARVFAERPSCLLHVGDIVGVGPERREWVEEFFGPAHELLAHVPTFTILGNHEEDAAHYYEYMANPGPEHRYTFRWGDAEVFALDSNRSLAAGSEQLRWLEAGLAASRAPWRLVMLHHPPYTSDLDDYRDPATGLRAEGDPRCRDLIPVLERHGVDVVFFGHIHAYERSWPLRAGKVDEADGVVYVQTGGAGGYLETSAPNRTWHAAHLRRAHHYLLVEVLGDHLEVRAYDREGRLFDRFERRRRTR